jgi:hypothetical protein
MSGQNEPSKPSTEVPAANINITAGDQSNFSVTGSNSRGITGPNTNDLTGTSTKELQNSNVGGNASKRPASPTGEDNPRPKRQREASGAQSIPPSALQHLASLFATGGMYVPAVFDLRRIFGIQSRSVPDPPPHPIPTYLTGIRISDRPKPTPAQVTNFDIVVRTIQASAIPDMGYTDLDMHNLEKYIVPLLSGKLNRLLDQDAQNFRSPQTGELPGRLNEIVLNEVPRPSAEKRRLVKWCKGDSMRFIDFPDIEAYRNRLHHFLSSKELSIQ